MKLACITTTMESSRLPPSSSVLQALGSLTPPSPILSPSQLPVTWTSGDIPILFIGSPRLHTFDFDDVTLCPSTNEEALSPSKSVDSMETVETTGTFGPMHLEDHLDKSESWSHALSTAGDDSRTDIANSGSTLSSAAAPLSASRIIYSSENREAICHDSVPASPGHPPPSSGRSTSSFNNTSEGISNAPLSHCESVPMFRVTATPSASNLGFHLCDGSPQNEEDAAEIGQILRYIPPSRTFSALSTPRFALPSPSDSVDTSLSCPSSPRFKSTFSRSFGHDSRQGSSCNSQGAWRVPSEEPLRTSPPDQSYPLLPNSTPTSPTTSHFNTRHHFTKSSLGQPVNENSGFQSVSLPKTLFWLKDVTIELHIDQEGFRSIQPSFRLVGYSSKFRYSAQPVVTQSHGTVASDGALEFMPVKRQSFLFHHAPFDSPPILRRITVNGDGSRDYIARQASLSLKSNSVYSVRGNETSALAGSSIGYSTDAVKLKWKFDYVVDDRRVEATGRIMDGEKTLTPLTFSCSPLMLHSLQGKKITLMHIVRKSVVPNLAAEKLEPPKLVLRSMLSMSNLKTNLQTTTSHYLAKPHPWNKHRRACSHAVGQEDQENLIVKSASGRKLKSFGELVSSRGPLAATPHPRRRRASSAGEQSRSNPYKVEGELGASESSHSKHIIPRSRLCELLAEEATQAGPGYQHGFQGLSPRKRIHR